MKTLYRVYKWVNIFNAEEWKGLLNFLKILKKPRSTHSEKVIRYLKGRSEEDYQINEQQHIKKVKSIFFGKGSEKVDKTQFANKIRYLIDFIESYTIYLYTNEDKQYRKIILKDALKEKGLNEESERIRNSFLKYYENSEQQGVWQLYQQFEVLHNKYHDAINDVNDSKKGQEIFRDMSLTLDEFLIISKLRVACEALTRNTFLNEKHQISMIADIELEASYRASNSPIIQMYLQVLRLIKGEADWDIAKLNEYFRQNKHKLYRDDLHFLLIRISSYINHIINNTKTKKAHKAALDFYRLLLDEVYLNEHKEIHPALLKNIIALALSLGEKTFAEQILKKYGNSVALKQRESMQQLCEAMLLCHDKDWKKLGALLLTISLKDIHIGTAVYNYQIICAYEDEFLIKKEKDLVLHYCTNFEKYLNRQDIDNSTKLMYNNMIAFVRRLVKGKDKIEDIRFEFEHIMLIASQKWLNQKISAIENKD